MKTLQTAFSPPAMEGTLNIKQDDFFSADHPRPLATSVGSSSDGCKQDRLRSGFSDVTRPMEHLQEIQMCNSCDVSMDQKSLRNVSRSLLHLFGDEETKEATRK